MGAVTFREALELIECLTEEERRDLIEIVRRRLVKERRGNIAKSIHLARGEFAHGEVKRGIVEDLVGGLATRDDCFESFLSRRLQFPSEPCEGETWKNW